MIGGNPITQATGAPGGTGLPIPVTKAASKGTLGKRAPPKKATRSTVTDGEETNEGSELEMSSHDAPERFPRRPVIGKTKAAPRRFNRPLLPDQGARPATARHGGRRRSLTSDDADDVDEEDASERDEGRAHGPHRGRAAAGATMVPEVGSHSISGHYHGPPDLSGVRQNTATDGGKSGARPKKRQEVSWAAADAFWDANDAHAVAAEAAAPPGTEALGLTEWIAELGLGA